MTGPAAGLNLIYARSLNFCIGVDGGLPWHLPKEYQHFEAVTRGFPLIMGRKSYQDHDGLLPNSPNIIVTSQGDLPLEPEAFRASSLDDGVAKAKALNAHYFVIGGAGLLAEALPNATCVYESVINTEITGDTYVPDFDFSGWKSQLILDHPADHEHPHGFKAYRHQRVV